MAARAGTSHEVHIPKRVAAIVGACPEAATICELGYDRGLILWSVLAAQPSARGLGIEVQPASAHTTPIPYDLAHRVELRTGDGLLPLAPEEATGLGVILAGLGGRTIAKILEARPDITRRLAWVVACPSHLEADIRPALSRLGLTLIDERLVEDRGRFYEVMVARPSSETRIDLPDEIAAIWGPHLVGRPDPLMAAYLDDQEQRFSEAFKSNLASYHGGPKAALGRKLALLAAARARVDSARPCPSNADPLLPPPDRLG